MHGTRRFGSVAAALCAALACSSGDRGSDPGGGAAGTGGGDRRRLTPPDARRPSLGVPAGDGGESGDGCRVSVVTSPRGAAPPDWEREPPRPEATSTSGRLALANTDEFPDVLRRGGALAASVALSVGVSLRDTDPQRARLSIEIARPGTCTPLRVLESIVDVQRALRISLDWDGNDGRGQPLPDGEYLYRARVQLDGNDAEQAVTPYHVVRLTGLAAPDECEAAAHRARAEGAPGASPAELDEKLHRDLAFCANPASGYCEAALVAQVNADRRAAVLRYLSGTFSTREELAVNHDRARKYHAALDDAALLAAICAGDGDGDLVPDSTDVCPETPPLTPTTADGCTDPALPRGPDRRHVDAILATMGVVHDERCNGAAAPATPHGAPFGSSPLALLQCAVTAKGRRGVVFTAVTNQPPGCPYWYQVKARVVRHDGTEFDVFVSPRNDTLLPLTGHSGKPYVVLEFGPDAAGALGEWARADVLRVNVSTRVMNGSGLSSPWTTPVPVYVMSSECAPAVEGDL